MSVVNNNLLLTGDDGYQIERSLRLRSSASAFLNRTPASAGNRKTWTWSGWVKRGGLDAGSNHMIFTARIPPSGANFALMFFSSEKLAVSFDGSRLDTTAVFRDFSAWYHVVFSIDTTQATASNRTKIYVNGVEQPLTGTYVSQNFDTQLNNTIVHNLGQQVGIQFFDGYLTEINFVDGQALTPSDFGEFNALTGVWQPKAYAGTYGTNGFYLNFSDNASTSALGTDYSGNGNNWTTNNISLTAGATFDSMIDVPTPYDDGDNGRGNYAVLNPLRSANAPTSGNLDIAFPTASRQIGSTIALPSSGKWYFEATLTALSGPAAQVGVSGLNYSTTQYPGAESDSYVYSSGGEKANNNSFVSYGASWTVNDVIGVAADVDAGTLVFYKNGVSQGTAYSGINLANTFFVVGMGGVSINYTANFGQRPFAYTPPTGFKALNTQNLPEPVIARGNLHFDATTYTGNASTNVIVNSGAMQPDLIWTKRRSATNSHQIFDSLRGVTLKLSSDANAAETSAAGQLVSINSNGFTLSNNAFVNSSPDAFVAWQWRASNAAAVTNTDGSITSTVSANPTAGFSIVTFTDPGTTCTVGHGLGVAPDMIIVKFRDASGNWSIYHKSLGATKRLIFTTSAELTGSGWWNNTAPTSSVFTLGSNLVNSSTQVAYCFSEVAGYSRFGSYTGNGSADGPFVFCGFRPAYVMYKRTDASGTDWVIVDSKRDTYNITNKELYANLSDTEGIVDLLDFTSNGFKCRRTHPSQNASGGTYIFMAFAESPFKHALAR